MKSHEIIEQEEIAKTLLRMHDSVGEGIPKHQLHNVLGDLTFYIPTLIREELVELDESDLRFYLTHEGYESVEAIFSSYREPVKIKRQRLNILEILVQWLIVPAILASLWGDDIPSSSNPFEGFTEEQKADIQRQLDSLGQLDLDSISSKAF
ncbi:MAG: hypothetical protein AAF598_18850 [Bacteroidota bacterium]